MIAYCGSGVGTVNNKSRVMLRKSLLLDAIEWLALEYSVEETEL